jgi:uncharacterized membrane protein
MLLTPLALAVLELTHPLDAHDSSPTWWTTLHLIQMPLFGLLGLTGYWLVRREDIERWAPPVIGALMGVFVVYYTALDAVAGVALGRLLGYQQTLPPDQQPVVAHAIDALYTHTAVLLFFDVGTWAWILGVVVAAFALARAGLPWPPVVLLAVSVIPLHQDHGRPYGPIAFTLFLVATLWLELWPNRGPVFMPATAQLSGRSGSA